jgi:hypothetical protein
LAALIFEPVLGEDCTAFRVVRSHRPQVPREWHSAHRRRDSNRVLPDWPAVRVRAIWSRARSDLECKIDCRWLASGRDYGTRGLHGFARSGRAGRHLRRESGSLLGSARDSKSRGLASICATVPNRSGGSSNRSLATGQRDFL